MKFAAFRTASERAYREIPEHFKAGIDGLIVSREAVPDADHDGVYVMGECLTERWPSDWGGPETTRSSVALYWGSFRQLARDDSEFDWEGEIWETLTHELRHHLESLASEDQLEDVDYAVSEGFKREEGQEFDPWYYLKGEPQGGDVYRLEHHVLIEQRWRTASFEAADEIAFQWGGRNWAVPRPEQLGDVHFVWVHGATEAPETLELVLVRRHSWWQSVTGVFAATRLEVLESEAEAEERP